ncbi:protein of unknown function [Methylacidimicrobium sp. AP8]|nr:protein of unknown function [Methylacidimicrobium sp. AP8]
MSPLLYLLSYRPSCGIPQGRAV